MSLTPKRKVIGYIRVSTEKQETDTPSLDNQANSIKEWAALNGYELLGTYEDTASGRPDGSAARRPGLQQAIDEANHKGVDVVFTCSSRISRNEADAVQIMKRLKGKIITIAEPHRRAGARSKKAIRQSVAEAQAQADALAARTSSAMRQLVASGRHVDNLGNKRTAALSSLKVRRENADIAIEQIARVLAESPAHCQLTDRELKDLLNARKFYSGSGKPWTVDGLRRPRRKAVKLLKEQAELDAEEDAGPFAPAVIQTDGFHFPAAVVQAVKPASDDQDASETHPEGAGAADRSKDEEEHPYANHPLYGLF